MKKTFQFTFLLLLVLAIAACGKDSGGSAGGNEGGSQGTVPTASQSTGKQEEEKVLTIAQANDIVTFDIHNHGNSTQTGSALVNVFEYLVNKDQDMNFVSGLAESWERVDDTKWVFNLRKDVTFHNGDPLTSADVKFSLDRVRLDEKLTETGAYATVQDVNIVDDYTIEIITKQLDLDLLTFLTRLSGGILPANYFQQVGIEGFLKEPVGTGPYKFSKWIKDDRLELVKNEQYYKGEPQWDKVVFRAIPEDSTRVAELLTGGVDIAANIPPIDMDRIESNDGTYSIQGSVPRVMSLFIRHTEGSVTANPKVREAIELAIDSQAIIDNIVEGAGTLTRTSLSPGIKGVNMDLYGVQLYDPERAKQLLVEAGYPDGLDLTLTSPNGRFLKDKEISETVAAYLGEVGIRVNLQLLEWSKYSEINKAKAFEDIYVLGGAGNDLFNAVALENFSTARTKNSQDYSNPQVDALLVQAKTTVDPEARAALYEEVQAIVAEDRPRVYLFHTKNNFGVNDRLAFIPRIDEVYFAEQIKLK